MLDESRHVDLALRTSPAHGKFSSPVAEQIVVRVDEGRRAGRIAEKSSPGRGSTGDIAAHRQGVAERPWKGRSRRTERGWAVSIRLGAGDGGESTGRRKAKHNGHPRTRRDRPRKIRRREVDDHRYQANHRARPTFTRVGDGRATTVATTVRRTVARESWRSRHRETIAGPVLGGVVHRFSRGRMASGERRRLRRRWTRSRLADRRECEGRPERKCPTASMHCRVSAKVVPLRRFAALSRAIAPVSPRSMRSLRGLGQASGLSRAPVPELRIRRRADRSGGAVG